MLVGNNGSGKSNVLEAISGIFHDLFKGKDSRKIKCDFLIEDYFSWDDTIKAIAEDVIPDRKHPIKMLPNLPDKIKKELEKRINKIEADEFNGFIPLLDKIVELTKEQAV